MNMSLMRSVMVTLFSRVDVPDVTGVQPAVGVDGLGGGLGVVEVADHHLVAARHDLTLLAGGHLVAVGIDDLHLDAGERPPRRVGDDLGVVVVSAHGDGAGGLGEAVAGDDRVEPELARAACTTSSTGTTAAPVTARRSDDRSYSLTSVLRMVW